MEGFALIDTGIWSIVPPLLALGLALLTKEVYSSLTIGVFVGMVIYTFTIDGVGFGSLVDAFCLVPQMMGEQIANNGALLLFLALLGALVVLIAIAGGSRAYGAWVSQHVKSARLARVMTAVLGILIFVDDYFNCLTVGAVMRPITDRFRMSHEKLAWLIDSSAAPVCIIAPVSSWAVAVGGYLGDDGFNLFVQSIPYNFYALATIVFVFFVAFIGLDFGPMKKAEEAAVKYGSAEAEEVAVANPGKVITHPDEVEGDTRLSVAAERTAAKIAAKNNPQTARDLPATVIAEETELAEAFEANKAEAQFKGMEVSNKGKVFDLIVPILVLIVFSIWGMLYIGGFLRRRRICGCRWRESRCWLVYWLVCGAGRGCCHVPASRLVHAPGLYGRRCRRRALHGWGHYDSRARLVARRRVPLHDRHGTVRQRFPEWIGH